MGVFLRGVLYCFERNLRVKWNILGIADSGELLDFSPSRFGIHSLGITLFANLKRRVNKDLHKPVSSHHAPYIIAGGAVGADSCTNRHTPVANNLSSHKTNSANIGITIF